MTRLQPRKQTTLLPCHGDDLPLHACSHKSPSVGWTWTPGAAWSSLSCRVGALRNWAWGYVWIVKWRPEGAEQHTAFGIITQPALSLSYTVYKDGRHVSYSPPFYKSEVKTGSQTKWTPAVMGSNLTGVLHHSSQSCLFLIHTNEHRQKSSQQVQK